MFGRPSQGLEVVIRPSQRYGRGRETLLVVRKWLGDYPGGEEVFGRPSRRSGSWRETLP